MIICPIHKKYVRQGGVMNLQRKKKGKNFVSIYIYINLITRQELGFRGHVNM